VKRKISPNTAHLSYFDMTRYTWTHDKSGETLEKNLLVKNKHPEFSNEWYDASFTTKEEENSIVSIVQYVEFEDSYGDKYAFQIKSPFLIPLYRTPINAVIVFDADGGGIVYY
jgi:hypothetical protein